jgi:hypothetical protein
MCQQCEHCESAESTYILCNYKDRDMSKDIYCSVKKKTIKMKGEYCEQCIGNFNCMHKNKTLFESEEQVDEFFSGLSHGLAVKYRANRGNELRFLREKNILKKSELEIAKDEYIKIQSKLHCDYTLEDMAIVERYFNVQDNEISRLNKIIEEK